MLNKSLRDIDAKVSRLEERTQIAERERNTFAERCAKLEAMLDQVKDGVVKIEREVEIGMEKAKEEVIVGIDAEKKQRDARTNNIVIYGLEETKVKEPEKIKEAETKKVKKMVEVIGVELKGPIDVKFRAGKPREEGEKPRPLIVQVEDEETKERILADARKLSRDNDWKRVFVSRDMTWNQREEGRKEEKRLKEEAEKKTDEAKNEGKKGRYLVVGPRGTRRIIWKEEEDE